MSSCGVEGEVSDAAETAVPFATSQTMAGDGMCWVKGYRREEGFVREAFEDLGNANPGCGEWQMGQQE